jgi:hypothetical protein
MTERLVDVLNDKNTVLQVYPTSVGDANALPKNSEFELEALKAAADAHLVSEAECESLRARMHVARGGQLAPYGAKKA